jgi:hypothetical protein
MTIHRTLLIPLIAVAWALFGAQAGAQHVAEGPRCKPVGERTGELGCWIMTDQALGQLGKSEVFLDSQDAVSSRTCSASQRNETVKQAHRGTWLRKSWQVAFSSSTIF